MTGEAAVNSHSQPASRLIAAVRQAYGWLLAAYPAPFSEKYGEEMREVFADMADEAAGGGTAALLAFALRESLSTLAAIFRSWFMRRGSLARRSWDAFLRLFQPGEGPVVDGRGSWAQALLEAAVFLLLGSVLAAHTYLPFAILPVLIQRGLGFLSVVIVLAPVLLLFAGIVRGMPRWAFPLLSVTLLGSALYFLPFFAYAIAAGVLLVLLEALFGHRRKTLGASLKRSTRRFLGRIARDPILVSFGLYGIMPLVVMIAFDDSYVNNHTAWYLAAVLGMIAGSLLYSRSRAPLLQIGSLLLGVSLVFLASVMDRAAFTRTGWPDKPWFLTLWSNLFLTILIPPALGLAARLLSRRKAAE